MALPPPLPGGRLPPPLPTRAKPPALPLRPGQNPHEFERDADRKSTRDQPFLSGGQIFERTIACNSTNVNTIRAERNYNMKGELIGTCTIIIEFLSGATYEYPDRPMNDFLDLFTSSSKGRYTYYEVRGEGPSYEGMGLWKPFRKIKPAWRTSGQVAAMKEARRPRTEEQKRRYYNVGGKRKAGGGIPS